jgi:hypothetical protein
MRFGKRNRSPLSWAKRGKGTPEKATFEPVVSQERSALLSPGDDAVEHFPEEAVSSAQREATQRLLDALKRFERQVLKAKEGVRQEYWSDQCMQHLIAATELAVAEGWQDVVEALTETARILQTYEHAGRASECVPFLADSFEILCLMAGDLIVDKVRAGVMRKWRERHARALEELSAAGLALVHDEAASAEQPADTTPVPEPWDEAGEPDASFFAEPEPEPEAPEPEDAGAQAEPIDAESLVETSWGDEHDPAAAEAEPAEQKELSVAEVLDSLCEGLSRIEKQPGDGLVTTILAMEQGMSVLEQRADEAGRAGCTQVCQVMSRLLDWVQEADSQPSDRFFELAYAFCGVYADSEETGDIAASANWVAECEAFLDEDVDAATEAAEAPEIEEVPAPSELAEPPEEPDAAEAAETAADAPVPGEAAPGPGGALQSLFEQAREAMAHGSSADAKRFALQAAAAIAQGQASESEARVSAAESKLRSSADEVETARAEVLKAEQAVSHSENRITECEQTAEEGRGRTATAVTGLREAQNEVNELEERIRELQARRDEALRRRGEREKDVESAQQDEAQAQAALDETVNAEEAARVALEDARQKVKALQQKRGEIQGAMERARETLERQRNSLADIEKAIEQIQTTESAAADGDELLF